MNHQKKSNWLNTFLRKLFQGSCSRTDVKHTRIPLNAWVVGVHLSVIQDCMHKKLSESFPVGQSAAFNQKTCIWLLHTLHWKRRQEMSPLWKQFLLSFVTNVSVSGHCKWIGSVNGIVFGGRYRDLKERRPELSFNYRKSGKLRIPIFMTEIMGQAL